ncbi:hypothetical protein IFM89_023781 [Coptis chinensis]|uniref:Increased DNA methylation 1 C-terminal domain-containing protein n=1 Tax=Coptis chinensis TaxID=261450 RepID=A0A835HET4_9MAGN|nr:hypothetical protein IFM89_023781 [Coptis chinensis]
MVLCLGDGLLVLILRSGISWHFTCPNLKPQGFKYKSGQYMFVDYEVVCSFKWSIKDQDFGGMCCAVLTVKELNSTVVTVATLQIFGSEIDEIPLVVAPCTSDNQGLNYFQSLFTCIERLLGFLNVKNIVLPSTEESKSIWTNKFGFKKISPDQCEREYHVSCLKVHKMADLKKQQEKCPDNVTGFDVIWRLLSGKMASLENKLLLSKAMTIPYECWSISSYDYNHLMKEYALVKTNEVLVVVYHA